MTIAVPNLDDRRFADLVREAREQIAVVCPEWTDLSVHDPGMVLVEAFAHLTEVMLYRLNRLPELAFAQFLNLLGVVRHPPSAAWTELTFTRTAGSDTTQQVVIPAGTRIAAARDNDPQPVVFVVTTTAVLPAGQAELSVPAYHCEAVDAELLGVGSGVPGQVLRAARPPIVTTAEALDVMLGVATPADELAAGATAREYGGATYEIWRQVDTFAGVQPTDRVYRLDRESGTVTFGPALDLRGAAESDPAQAGGTALAGVSSLAALAVGVDARDVLAVVDARRGEAFVAGFRDGEQVLAPAALAPDALERLALPAGGGTWLAGGDGAVRFRGALERAGATVLPDIDPAHRISAAATCRLARAAGASPREDVLPIYVRAPDAVMVRRAGGG